LTSLSARSEGRRKSGGTAKASIRNETPTFDYQYGEDGIWLNVVRVGSLHRRRRAFQAADWWIESSSDKESEGGGFTEVGDEL